MASDGARRVDVPPSILKTDALGDLGYTFALELPPPPPPTRARPMNGHEASRKVRGRLRRFVVACWVIVLRPRLAPRQVLQVQETGIVHVSRVRYNGPVARLF